MTADELAAQASAAGRCGLVAGVLIRMSSSGFRQGEITAMMTHVLGDHVYALELGVVVGAETGFLISRDPDTVRAPDVGFVSKDRLHLRPGQGYPAPPDLAIEVLSPDDRASDVLNKTNDRLAAGCQAVWIVDPQSDTVSVHRSDRATASFGPGETLTGQSPLSDLELPIDAVFE